MTDNRPKIGVGVIVRKDKKVLLGKRKNAHGEGSRAFPGGHLEFHEHVEDCAKREVMEETGITVKNIKTGEFTNDMFIKENMHYVTLYAVCDYDQGEIKIMEPHKCEKREWFEREHLPSPLFFPIENLQKQEFHPFK